MLLGCLAEAKAGIRARHVGAQTELSRNKCRPQRIDIWQQAVDTDVFNPAFRSEEMRARMSGGKADAVILTYVGRLGAGEGTSLQALLYLSRTQHAPGDRSISNPLLRHANKVHLLGCSRSNSVAQNAHA